jgi:hypothetical protein
MEKTERSQVRYSARVKSIKTKLGATIAWQYSGIAPQLGQKSMKANVRVALALW